MNLLVEYFTPESEERRNEYLTCLSSNIKNENITKIHLFIDDDSEIPSELNSDKLIINCLDKRNTYQDFFNYSNNFEDDQIWILANADIMFDNTLSKLNPNNLSNKFLALSRYDVLPNGKVSFYDRPYSQDVWIWLGKNLIKNANFTLGKLGCDNRITHIANQFGYIVTNPSKIIVTKHLHLSNYRKDSSDQSQIVNGHYIFVDSDTMDINYPSTNYLVSPNNVHMMVRQMNIKKGIQ